MKTLVIFVKAFVLALFTACFLQLILEYFQVARGRPSLGAMIAFIMSFCNGIIIFRSSLRSSELESLRESIKNKEALLKSLNKSIKDRENF